MPRAFQAAAAGAPRTSADAAGRVAAGPMTASTTPTSTRSPSPTIIRWRFPFGRRFDLGRHLLALDLEERLAALDRVPPTCLNHLLMTPSAIEAASWGTDLNCHARASPFGIALTLLAKADTGKRLHRARTGQAPRRPPPSH